MARQHIPLGKIWGIPVGLDYSWFLIFTLLTWMLADSYYPAEFPDWPGALDWGMGALTAMLFFASVLLHELGHSIMALHYRIRVRRITLHIFGGVAEIADESPTPRVEFLVALAGPLVSFVLAFVFHTAQTVLFPSSALAGLCKYMTYINLSLGLFNLIPGYPLDGGRLFRALLWAITGNLARATRIAAKVGRGFAFLLILTGIWQALSGNLGGGLWVAFIGWFLDNAAKAQLQQGGLSTLLSRHPVAQIMTPAGPVVSAELTLQQLVDEYILPHHARCFLVQSGQRLSGLVTMSRITSFPRSEWPQHTVREAMLPFDQVVTIDPGASLWDALQRMDRDGFNQLPVIHNGALLGMIKREDVMTSLRTLGGMG